MKWDSVAGFRWHRIQSLKQLPEFRLALTVRTPYTLFIPLGPSVPTHCEKLWRPYKPPSTPLPRGSKVATVARSCLHRRNTALVRKSTARWLKGRYLPQALLHLLLEDACPQAQVSRPPGAVRVGCDGQGAGLCRRR